MASFEEKQQMLNQMLLEIEQLQASQKPKETTTEKVLNDFVALGSSGMKGIAKTLGLPADLANMVLDIGKNFSTSSQMFTRTEAPDAPPFRIGGTTEDVREIFEGVGISTSPEYKTTAGRYIGRGVEEATAAAGAASPFLRSARNVALTAQPSKTIGGTIMQEIAKRPGVSTAAEAGLGFTAGIGGEAAVEAFPESPFSEPLGQLGGGFAPSIVTGIGRSLAKVKPGARSEEKVRDILDKIVTNKEAAIESLSGADTGTARATQVSGDTGLLDLEASVLQADEAFKGDYEAALDGIRQANKERLETVLKGNESPEELKTFIETRKQKLSSLINRRIQQAANIADKKIQELDVPYASAAAEREGSSRIAREALEEAYTNAKNQEQAEWGKVDFDIKADTAPITRLAQEIRSRRGKFSNPDNHPTEILSMILGKPPEQIAVQQAKSRAKTQGLSGPEKLKARREAREAAKDLPDFIMLDKESAKDLHELRSYIMDAKRKENGETVPNRAKLKILDDLQDTVLDVLEQSVSKLERTDSVNGSQLRVAMDYTRNMHDKFTRGAVGKILKYDSLGGERVPDIQTLRMLIRPGEIGASSADDMIKSVDELINAVPAEQIKQATETYLKSQFVLSATNPSGTVNPRASRAFLKSYAPVLNRFPELKAQLGDTAKAQEIADSVVKSGEKRLADINDKNKSRAALYLELGSEKPEIYINKILNKDNPNQAEDMRKTMAMANKDKTGRALEGLKTATFDHMWSKITHDMSIDGDYAVAKRLSEYIASSERGLRELYGNQGIRFMKRIAEDVAKSERKGKGAAIDEVGKRGILAISAIGRIIGTKVGPKFGVSPLVSAGIGRTAALEILKKPASSKVRQLLVKALDDPQIMRTLLMDPAKPETAKRLRTHLISIGVPEETLTEETE